MTDAIITTVGEGIELSQAASGTQPDTSSRNGCGSRQGSCDQGFSVFGDGLNRP